VWPAAKSGLNRKLDYSAGGAILGRMTKFGAASPLFYALLIFACDPGSEHPPAATGGAPATGTGGSAGPASGGTRPAGGSAAAGASTGGSAMAGTSPGSGGGGQTSASGGTATSGGSSPTSGGTPPLGGGGGANPQGGNGAGTAGTSAGGSGAACAGALFCDDFEAHESGKAPGAEWTARVSAGAVSVDGTQHHSGAKAVKFTTEGKAGTKTAFIRLKSDGVFPAPGNAFYGRMMYFLEAAPTAAVHWTILQATGTVPGQNYRAQYRYGGQHPVMQESMFVGSQLMANYETPDSYSGTGPSTDCWQHANQTVLPVGKWTCVEWQFDGPKNQLRFWLDAQPVESLSVNGTGQGCVGQAESYVWTAPDFAELEIGWESYQEDGARTAYIDDLVISSEPIGCPP
jgi:hypothetical protein